MVPPRNTIGPVAPHGPSFCGSLRRRGLVVELEDVSRVWIGISSNSLAVVVEVVRVGEGLLAIRAMMISSVFEIALPGRVDAVRQDGADAAVEARRLGQLVESERLVHVDAVPDIDEVVPVIFSCGPPSFVPASFEDQVREVRRERYVPRFVLEGQQGGRDPLRAQCFENVLNMMNWSRCGSVFASYFLPVIVDVLGEVDVEEALSAPVA